MVWVDKGAVATLTDAATAALVGGATATRQRVDERATAAANSAVAVSEAGEMQRVAGALSSPTTARSAVDARIRDQAEAMVGDVIASDPAVTQTVIDHISANPQLLGELAYYKGSVVPITTPTLDDLQTGQYSVVAGGHAATYGLPRSLSGVVEVTRWSGTAGLMSYEPAGPEGETWRRRLTSTGWQPWERTDVGAAPKWLVGGVGIVGAPQTLEELPSGIHTVWSGAGAAALGLPVESPGYVETVLWGTLGMQKFTAAIGNEVHSRRLTSTGWQPWERVDIGAIAPVDVQAPNTSGFKTVPLALTLGTSTANASLSQTYRIPIRYAAPITRWRLHVTNRNLRSGEPHGSGINVEGVWVGEHAGSGAFTAAPTQVAGAFEVPSDGSEWVSPWQQSDIGGDIENLVSFSYTAATAPPVSVAGGWTTSAKVASEIAPPLTLVKSMALDLWIEAETYFDTPVLAGFGDSLSSGAQATLPRFESTIEVKSRELNALPVHWAVSSDSMTGWTADFNAWKWRRWDGLALADACLFSMGHNDVYGLDKTASECQAMIGELLPYIRQRISPNVVASTITPRNNGTVEKHAERNTYNAWLKGAGRTVFRDLFDFDAVISNGNTIRPEFDADGIHLNSAGYVAQAGVITRPVVAPALR